MALSDCNQLAHVISSLANTKIYVTVPFLLCFILYLRAISKHKPPGAYNYSEGRFNRGFLVLRLGGLHLEGLIFGVLRYVVF